MTEPTPVHGPIEVREYWQPLVEALQRELLRMTAERDEAREKLMTLDDISFVRWTDDWPTGDEIKRYIANLKAERDAALKLVDDTLLAIGAVEVRDEWKP